LPVRGPPQGPVAGSLPHAAPARREPHETSHPIQERITMSQSTQPLGQGTSPGSQPVDSDVVWLTQDAYDKLQAELGNLRGPVREEIVARIAAARDEGDLRENGGYHAAREEQGKAEARIRQLEEMLRRAQVGETTVEAGKVAPGMVVTIRWADDPDTEKFLLGAREMAHDVSGLEVYSPQSPMGSALLGKSVGSTVDYAAPNGRTLKVEIVDAVPYST